MENFVFKEKIEINQFSFILFWLSGHGSFLSFRDAMRVAE